MSAEQAYPPVAARAAYHRAEDLHDLRLWAQAYAIGAGLTPTRAELLMLAISELASNTLLYTSGGGLVEMRAVDGGVVCEVTDDGPVAARAARAMPRPDAPSGRGLAIVAQVCDDVAIHAEGAHTVVRLWVKSG